MSEDKFLLVPRASADFGQVLIDEAIESNRSRLQAVVVRSVADMLGQADYARDISAKLNDSVKALEARIAALKAGEFEIDRYAAITFKDSKLNEPIDWIAQCSQCGYKKMVIARP